MQTQVLLMDVSTFSIQPIRTERLLKNLEAYRLVLFSSRIPAFGLWKYGNKWIVTKELQKKLGEEGFSFLRSVDNTHFFARERDHLLIAVTSVVDNNVPILALLYNYDESVFSGGSKGLKAQGKMMKNFMKVKKVLKF